MMENPKNNVLIPIDYVSKTKIFGLPLLHISQSEQSDDKIKMAKGIIAIGSSATGVIAIGGTCIGIITIGNICIGVISLGSVSIGVLFSLGFFSAGWISLGLISIGYYSVGFLAFGKEFLSSISSTPYIKELIQKFLSKSKLL